MDDLQFATIVGGEHRLAPAAIAKFVSGLRGSVLSISETCSATRCSRVALSDLTSSLCASTVSCSALIRSMERTRASSAE